MLTDRFPPSSIAGGGSWDYEGVVPAAEASQSGYMMAHADDSAPSAVDGGNALQTSDPYPGAYPPSPPPPADASATGAYGYGSSPDAGSSIWSGSSWSGSATPVIGESSVPSAAPSPPPAAAPGNASDAGLVAGPYQVVVAPKKGDLR